MRTCTIIMFKIYLHVFTLVCKTPCIRTSQLQALYKTIISQCISCRLASIVCSVFGSMLMLYNRWCLFMLTSWLMVRITLCIPTILIYYTHCWLTCKICIPCTVIMGFAGSLYTCSYTNGVVRTRLGVDW